MTTIEKFIKEYYFFIFMYSLYDKVKFDKFLDIDDSIIRTIEHDGLTIQEFPVDRDVHKGPNSKIRGLPNRLVVGDIHPTYAYFGLGMPTEDIAMGSIATLNYAVRSHSIPKDPFNFNSDEITSGKLVRGKNIFSIGSYEVQKDHRNQGIGSKLFNFVEGEAKKQGHEFIIVEWVPDSLTFGWLSMRGYKGFNKLDDIRFDYALKVLK